MTLVDIVESPANSVAEEPPAQPAEPCPTPLSTVEVFESFGKEADSWELEGPCGVIRGESLGQGPALYFLNGLEGTSDLFRLVAWLLREDFRCVLFDLAVPGNEILKQCQTPGDLPDVRQLLAIGDGFEDDSFHLYATGFGGWVALATMIAHGERIGQAVLQGGYAKRKFRLLEKCLLTISANSQRKLQDVPGWKNVFRQNHARWFPPFDAVRYEIFEAIAGGCAVGDLSRRLRQVRIVEVESALNKIKSPILLLGSEGEGKLHSRQAEFLSESLPTSRTERLQNSGLVPHWTHPHRVAKLIRQFILGDEPSGTTPSPDD